MAVTGVTDAHDAFVYKQVAVAGIACRQHAVEHIHTPVDRLDNVLRTPYPIR